jgi:hypothetical protein
MAKNAAKSCELAYTSREVICDKLLVALADDAKVAVILTESDIKLLIAFLSGESMADQRVEPLASLLRGLKELKQAAFGR